MDVERQFEQLLPLIDQVAASTSRRHALSDDEGEEFSSWLKLRLVESDYAALRKFRGSSSLRTYLVVVIKNLFQDYRVAKWGKWRPSAAAKRAGDVGVQLESLLYRDGLSLSDAVTILRENHGVRLSGAELEGFAVQLRPRLPRRFEGDRRLGDMASEEPTPLERTEVRARKPAERRLERVLRRALESQADEDRVILRLRYSEGLKIVDIARSLGLEQRSLYGRIQRLLRGIRQRLEAEGFSTEQVIELVRASDLDLDLSLEDLGPDRAAGRGSSGDRPAEAPRRRMGLPT